MIKDTIAAIATPYGSGGIGIIRISGPLALNVAAQIFSSTKEVFKTSKLISHRIYHGYIVDDQRIIDEVLLIPMKAPRSYTAEDVVEIQAHSGIIVLQTILDLVISKGARLSEPGEFTKRAFLNQRIDLTQAEAVADIINARSERALKLAAYQNLGVLKIEIRSLRKQLIELLSLLEVSIDFSEDLENVSNNSILKNAETILDDVIEKSKELIQQHQDACFLKEGIRMVICGKPNVGKSSLMNRLISREKAIVTAIPGTTRDPIEESLTIEGIPFLIIDTAGLHDTDDLVEIIGIERARDHIREANLILLMSEAGEILTKKDCQKIIPHNKRAIIVINKIDLVHHNDAGPHLNLTLPDGYHHLPVVGISALMNKGIEELKQKIIESCIQDLDIGESAIVPNLRHKLALEETLIYLESARKELDQKQEEEILSIDIKNSIDILGTITGENTPLDILDTIFSKFCIGK